MGKAAGAVVVVFLLGSGAMALLGSLLGTHAEAAAVTVMGLGLVGASSALSGKVPAAASLPKQA